jgi:adenylate cyclase
MIRRLEALNQEFLERDWPQISVGIGLGTGPMSVGNMGSEFRMAYTVLGDAVNLGSRLEGLTKIYGVKIIVGESTVTQVEGHLFRELDFVRVKGKQKPIRIYEPLGESGDVAQEVLDGLPLMEKALRLFREQDWDRAESAFRDLAAIQAHRLYELYQERIDHYRSNPPGGDWDGVFTYQVK